jgi:hypothetical protein
MIFDAQLLYRTFESQDGALRFHIPYSKENHIVGIFCGVDPSCCPDGLWPVLKQDLLEVQAHRHELDFADPYMWSERGVRRQDTASH